MARTSRRDTIQTKKIEIQTSMFRAGIYTRLSQDRTETYRNKSCSIESQVDICKEYLKKESISIAKVYTDYEYSGTNFERPQYQQMMQDVRDGAINCIIIRDLSRLGREHLEMGRLVDKVFPYLGIRFISVIDKIDTEHGVDPKLSFEILIKNLINEMYAKDIGQKVRSSKYTKAMSGYFIGSNPPFGYKVVIKDGGRKLEPDETSSPIVKEIFEQYAKGKSTYDITLYLNKNRIATSSMYFKTGDIHRKDGEPQWRKGTVANLLRRQVYIGYLVQGTKTTPNGKKSGCYEVKPQDEWFIVTNAHKPLVSKELFSEVQKMMDEKAIVSNQWFELNTTLKKDPTNRYLGLVYDGNTKEKLRRIKYRRNKKNVNEYSYRFTNKASDGRVLESTYISINEKDLDAIVLEKMKGVLSIDINGRNATKKVKDVADIQIRMIESKRSSISSKLTIANADCKKAYEDYSLGKISKSDYLQLREHKKLLISSYEDALRDLELEIVQIAKQRDKEVRLIRSLTKGKGKKLTRDLIRTYIERIDIYDKDTFTVTLKGQIEGGGGLHE